MKKNVKKIGKTRKEIFWVVMGSSLFTISLASVLLILFFNSIKSIGIDSYRSQYYVNALAIQNEMQDIIGYTNSLLLDNINNEILDLDSDDIDLSSYYPLSIRLKEYKDVNRIISSIAMYYPRQDLVISNIGSYRIREYYRLKTPYDKKDDYGDWYQYMLNREPGFDVVDNQLIYNVMVNKENTKQGLIQYKIDTDALFKISDDINLNSGVLNAIVVKDKILYQDEDTESFLNTLDVENLRNEDTIIKDSRYVGSFELSNLGMSVISIIDLSKYTNQVELYLNLLMFLFVAIILFSVVYSLRQSEKINKPIKELAAKIKDAEENKGLSNYEIINQRIDDFINSKDYLTTKLHEQGNTISTLFLYSLLHPDVREENAYIEMGTLHINFNYSSFYVGIMSDKNLSLTDLKYLVDEIEGDQMDIYTYICNSYLLFFLNTDVQDYEAEIIELFENYFKESNGNIDGMRLLVSSKCDGLSDLKSSYKTALALYNSNIARGYYVLENSTSNELKKSLEMNDNNLYFDAIDKIFNDNLKLSSSLVEEYVDLINTEFSDEILKEDVSGYYWKSDFINVIKQKAKSSEIIATRANEIIQNEFTNKDLGLYNIAERLDVSNSYLSTIYKDYYGRGIISTLNIKRIELAKVLLLNSNKSIKEVALEVGFASDISFIRVFKKLESQTPGKMRRLNSKRK